MFSRGCLSILSYLSVVPLVYSLVGEDGLQNLVNIPVCPQKAAGGYDHPYVIYGKNPAQCYEASSQGPCPHGSAIFAQPNSIFGVCSCECFLGEGEPAVFDNSLVIRYRYCFSSRLAAVFVYDKQNSSCYQLESQGPCPSGEILHKNVYEHDPKCVGNKTREDVSNTTHSPIGETTCPPGTIYSELLNTCTDMNFTGGKFSMLPGGGWSRVSNPPSPPNNSRCPPGTIYSTLLNKCTDMNFKGGKFPAMGWGSGGSDGVQTSSKCPPGTIYSTLLNKCTDMNFKGGRFPNMGWGSSTTEGSQSTSTSVTCPPGTIYSTLLNKCTDMNFHGGVYPAMGWGSSSTTTTTEKSDCNKTTTPPPAKIKPGQCPPGTIVSTLLNRCVSPKLVKSTERPL